MELSVRLVLEGSSANPKLDYSTKRKTRSASRGIGGLHSHSQATKGRIANESFEFVALEISLGAIQNRDTQRVAESHLYPDNNLFPQTIRDSPCTLLIFMTGPHFRIRTALSRTSLDFPPSTTTTTGIQQSLRIFG